MTPSVQPWSCAAPAAPSAQLTLGEALRWACGLLAASGVETPRLDAELLLGHVLRLDRPALYRHAQDFLSEREAQHYRVLVSRRLAHEPVAYILGRRAFYDVELWVDRRVLIPRPETEHLVEEALRWVRARSLTHPRVVDVGTGSGALAIVLARHLPGALVYALDISWEALQVAAANVRRWGLAGRIALLQGDLLAPLGTTWELIVANLPYVPRERLAALPADVAHYEPRIALDGGEQGLCCLRRLLDQAPARLARPGLLLLEVDDSHAEAVAALARERLPEADVSVLPDLAGLARLVRVETFAAGGA